MSTLAGVKRRIVINAGHHDADPGAVTAVERDEVKLIRDQAVPILRKMGFEVIIVPDSLNLPQSISFANREAPGLNEGLLIDIHLNASSDRKARGTEVFHYPEAKSKIVAERMAFHVARQLGIPNRGAKPDTQSYVGSLGWVRQTKAYSTLIEVCFITNADDMKALTAPGGYRKAAQGIADAVAELFGTSNPPAPPTPPSPTPGVQEAINLFEQGLKILKGL